MKQFSASGEKLCYGTAGELWAKRDVSKKRKKKAARQLRARHRIVTDCLYGIGRIVKSNLVLILVLVVAAIVLVCRQTATLLQRNNSRSHRRAPCAGTINPFATPFRSPSCASAVPRADGRKVGSKWRGPVAPSLLPSFSLAASQHLPSLVATLLDSPPPSFRCHVILIAYIHISGSGDILGGRKVISRDPQPSHPPPPPSPSPPISPRLSLLRVRQSYNFVSRRETWGKRNRPGSNVRPSGEMLKRASRARRFQEISP